MPRVKDGSRFPMGTAHQSTCLAGGPLGSLGPLGERARPLAQDNAYPGAWPRLMRAETAAAYVDEKSVDAFRRGVGTLWPNPKKVAGKGDRWLRDDLDRAIEQIATPHGTLRDAADVL